MGHGFILQLPLRESNRDVIIIDMEMPQKVREFFAQKGREGFDANKPNILKIIEKEGIEDFELGKKKYFSMVGKKGGRPKKKPTQ